MKPANFPALVCAIILSYTAADAQVWQWAKVGTSPGFEWGNGITTDDSSNVYVVGQFEYTSNFSGVNIVSRGQHDIFLAKYGPDGTLKWIRSAGGTDGDAGSAIDIDNAGNIYITGEYETTVYFTPTDSFPGPGANGIFLAKYNNNGDFLWAKIMGSEGDERGRGIVVDRSNGDIYFTGRFNGTANFTGQNITTYGSQDVFVARYDSSGVRQWVKKAGDNRDDRGRSIARANDGSIYVTASYTDDANVGGHNISSTGDYSAFLAKYDPSDGSVDWVKTHNGNDTTVFYGVDTDNDGNVYVTGHFAGNVSFGGTNLSSAGNSDVIIAKYRPDGTLVWVKRAGGVNQDDGIGLSFDKQRDIFYVTGMFDFQATFGSITVNSVANRDVYVAAYDTNGTALWVHTGGGKIRDFGLGIDVAKDGYIYVTGTSNDTAYFDTHEIYGSALPDVFVAKLSPSVMSEPAVQASSLLLSSTACNDAVLNWTNGDGSGRIVVARASAPVNVFPADGTEYVASSIYGGGADLGNDNFIVYNGTGSTVTVNGLNPGTTYHFAVLEYNGTGPAINYNTTSPPVNNFLANGFAITVNASANDICLGGSVNLQASGGVTYQWSPSTYLSGTTGANVVSTPTNDITYTVTGTDGVGCQAVRTVTIAVHQVPVVSHTSLQAVCMNAAPFILNGGTPAGGTYSGPGVSGSNAFIPSNAGAGTHSIAYTYTDAFGCSNSTQVNLTVHPLPQITIPSFTPVCIDNSSFALPAATPAGGTWSGPGVSGTNFSPSTAGVGNHIITYSVTDGNGCTNSASNMQAVNALPNVTLNLNPACDNETAHPLTGGSPAGGTYSGPNVNGNTFNAAAAGTGTYTILYEFTDINGCKGDDQASLTVNAAPSVSLGSFQDMCSGTSLTLTGGTPAGGVYSGTDVSAGTFNPSSGGNYMITYTYTSSNGCSDADSSSILVHSAPVVDLGADTMLCLNATFLLDAGAGFASYQWSDNSTAQTLQVSGAVYGLGAHTISVQVDDQNNCSGSDAVVITFDACNGITDIENRNMPKIYPNPFHGSATIDMTSPGEIRIFEVSGRLISSQKVGTGQTTICEDLASGVYFVKVMTLDYEYNLRVVKSE